MFSGKKKRLFNENFVLIVLNVIKICWNQLLNYFCDMSKGEVLGIFCFDQQPDWL